jgi:hypothetical protein
LPGQRDFESHKVHAGHPPAIEPTTTKEVALAGPKPLQDKAEPVPSSRTPAERPAAIPHTTSTRCPPLGPILADPALGLFADAVGDLEAVRIANENRLRQLTDPGELGHGLSVEHPQVRKLAELVDALENAEHQAVLSLKRAMRAHPLGDWVKATAGVGEKQATRLLASIRDPYWNDLHERPRTVSELWAYCGFHTVHATDHLPDATQARPVGGGHAGDHRGCETQLTSVARVAPVRRRGQKANWNSDARQRIWLVAVSCVKVARSPYRDVYDQARAKYSVAVHLSPCVRCGPSGTPAAIDSPLSLGHQHARAIRLMCKEILRDLWREAQKIHLQRAEAA